jgi:hypothetical protein
MLGKCSLEEEGRLPNCRNRDVAGENQEAGRDMKGKRRLTERKQEERGRMVQVSLRTIMYRNLQQRQAFKNLCKSY